MKKMVKGIAMALAAVMMLSMIAGCGNKETTSNEKDSLVWVIPGKVRAANEEVLSKFNEELEKAIGETIKFEIFSFSDYSQKLQLKLAANEEIDMMWAGNYLLPFTTMVRGGSYLELDELLEKEGKDLLSEIPEWAWKKHSYDGKIYAVPNMQQMSDLIPCLYTIKEQSDVHMDKQAVIDATQSVNMTQEGWDILSDYLKKLYDAGDIRKGVSTNSIPSIFIRKGFEEITTSFVIRHDDEKCIVENLYETEESKMLFKTMSEWYKNGYIVSDIASIDQKNQYERKLDGNVIFAHGYYRNIEVGQSKGAGFEIDATPCGKEYYISSTASDTATVICATSERAERAMKVLNYLNTQQGKDLYNMLVYGFEGVHYTKDSDTRITRLRGNDKDILYGIDRWVVGNTYNAYETDGDPQDWNNIVHYEVNDSARHSKLLGFKPDVTPVSNELVNISAAVDEYKQTLFDGAAADWEATYNDFIQKMKTCGSDRVIEVLQSQINEYLAKNK